MLKRLSALALALCLLAPLAARADQTSGCLPTSSLPGLTLVNTLNAWMKSASTTFSGTSAPATDCSLAVLTGQKWIDTTTAGYLKAKMHDGTSSVEYGRFDTANHWWVPPVGGGTASITSATTTDLWSKPEAAITVSGTTTITALANSSAVPGTVKYVTFSGILTLTHNGTSLIIPGAANITTAAGDTAEIHALTTSNVRVAKYTKASGLAIVPLAAASAHTIKSNITGSSAVPSDNSLSAVLDAELGSTQGQIIYRGASTWSVLSAGTAGQLLQTAGAGGNPAWVTVASRVLLATLTANNSASTLADTTSLTATYPAYEIIITNLIPASSTITCRIRVNVSGVQTSSYSSALVYTTNGANNPENQTTYVPCSGSSRLLNTGTGVNAQFTVMNPSQSSTSKAIFGIGTYPDSSTTIAAYTSGGYYTGGNAAVTGIEVSTSTGNWTSGTVKIYGLP